MSIPRQEHPRPDRYRDHCLNLNGVWEFGIATQEMGIANRYHEGQAVLPRKINVPFVPESRLSGIHDEGFHTTCWYQRRFELPARMQAGRQILHFGAVDYYAKIWLNGALIGDHKGGYSSFCFDVTGKILPCENVLCVLVEDDPAANKCRGKQMPYPHLYAEGCRYMRMTGIWQTVWLEQVGDVFVDDFRIMTDIRQGTVNIMAEIAGAASRDLKLNAKVFVGSETDNYIKARGTAAAQSGRAAELSIKLENPRLWTPDEPNIYYLRLDLENPSGAVVDSVRTYFGMREICIQDGAIKLNGKPIYLTGALDQGIYPDSLYTPPSDAAQKNDILLAKQCGLNWIRKHQIIPEARFFYWCDRLGLMVWSEMPDWGGRREDFLGGGAAAGQYSDEVYIAEMKAAFRRDINHPSIIGWCCNNERTLADDPENTRSKKRIYDAIKAFDSTRMVIDNSGYCHAETDICDFHVQWHNHNRLQGERILRELRETGNSMLTSDQSRPAYCAPYKWRGEPIIISETGNWNIAECAPEGGWKPYGSTVLTVEDWLQLYREYMSDLILNKNLSGFCYVQLYDTEGENNGYYTFSRKAKVPVNLVKSIHEKALAMRPGA